MQNDEKDGRLPVSTGFRLVAATEEGLGHRHGASDKTDPPGTTSPRSRKYYMITEYGRKMREKTLASLGSMNNGPVTAKAGYGGRSKCTRS